MSKVFEHGNYDKMEIPEQEIEPKVGELWYMKRLNETQLITVIIENITPKVVQFRAGIGFARTEIMKRRDVEFVERYKVAK